MDRNGRRASWRVAERRNSPAAATAIRSPSSASRGTSRVATTAPASSPIAGAATRSGSTPSDAVRVPGDRCAVPAELPQGDDRHGDEDEVEPESLGERSTHLPAEAGPDARDRAAERQRRQGQDEHAADPRDGRGAHGGLR